MPEPLVANSTAGSKPGATLRMARPELAPAGHHGLPGGAEVAPAGDLLLGIAVEGRPYIGEAVIDFYDGPLLVVLSSPLHGDFLAMALPDEEGAWPFLLVPATSEQVASVRGGTRGMRQHILEASRAHLVRDYGADELVARPVAVPVIEAWLPAVGS